MAPIDPKQLLQAFSPLLTSNGGIKNATEVPRLSSLMKKFSRKLVSRCVYCNVLLSTSPDVLEEFLRSGGWETIHIWIKSAKELGNRPFLDELLKLLLILPMTVERLKENDTPKIVNKLSKSDDTVFAQKARQIVDKWTKMITGVDKEVKKDVKEKEKKKRKTSEADKIESKKLKSTLKNDINSVDSTDSNQSLDITKIDKMEKMPIQRTPRASTVKVKPGKSRLDGLVNSTLNPVTTRKVSPNQSLNNKKLTISSKQLMIPSNKPINETLNDSVINNPIPNPPTAASVKKLSLSSSTFIPLGVTATPVVTPPPVQPSVKHVLQDSTSFMDALIAPPTLAKKKRRSSGASLPKDTTAVNNGEPNPSSSPKSSSPKGFSFYKDMIDEKVEPIVVESDHNSNESDSNIDNTNDDNSIDLANEESDHIDIDITVDDIKDSSNLPNPLLVMDRNSSNKLKPILCYTKKVSKKSVRWVEDTKLNRIKYFDLDETERVNVTRPTGSDYKRFDMKHEAEFMLMAKRSANTFDVAEDYQSRAQSFSQWKLISCDVDSEPIEYGKESKERLIQLERMKTTLESFYTRNQIPESPQEPEPESNVDSTESKIIPLEDDNNPNNVHDFSNIDLPQPKTGEHLPTRLPDFKSSASNNFRVQPNVSQFGPTAGPPLMPSGPPMMPFVPNIMPDPYVTQNNQFFPNGGQSAQSFPREPSFSPPNQHFQPQFPNAIQSNRRPPPAMSGNRPRLPRNAPTTVCRHWARTGHCRFQPRCSFLHSNP